MSTVGNWFMQNWNQLVLWIGRGALILLLAFNTFTDLKKREICLWSLLPAAIIGVGLNVCRCLAGQDTGPETILLICSGLLPGAFTMLAAKLFKGTVGFGDGLLIMVVGLYFNISDLLILLLLSTFAVGGAALFFLAVLKKGRKYELPFVPFLAFGSLAELLLGGIL